MRTKLIGLILGGGLIAATLSSSLACPYNTTSADNGAAPAQTAQADATAPAPTPDKN